jgi:hypothetical protein
MNGQKFILLINHGLGLAKVSTKVIPRTAETGRNRISAVSPRKPRFAGAGRWS